MIQTYVVNGWHYIHGGDRLPICDDCGVTEGEEHELDCGRSPYLVRFRELAVGEKFYFLSAYQCGERDIRYKVSKRYYADTLDGHRKKPGSRETWIIKIPKDEEIC